MITKALLQLVLVSTLSFSTPQAAQPSAYFVEEQVLAQHELDLTNRLPNEYGSQVFTDNILLALHFLKGDQEEFKLDPDKPFSPLNMNWEAIREPFEVSFTLLPGEVFAYHDNVLPEFKDKVIVTTNSRFYIQEGYKSLAGLGGNGVCHLASLMNWVASEAGLEVTAKVDHDFYPVPGIPRQFGASIRFAEVGHNSQNQNLYIENGFSFPVTFQFKTDKQKVVLAIIN